MNRRALAPDFAWRAENPFEIQPGVPSRPPGHLVSIRLEDILIRLSGQRYEIYFHAEPRDDISLHRNESTLQGPRVAVVSASGPSNSEEIREPKTMFWPGFAHRCNLLERVMKAVENGTAVRILYQGCPYLIAENMDSANYFIGKNESGVYSVVPYNVGKEP